MTVVDDYLTSLAAHDWATLRHTLVDEGLVRIGPYCDEVRGADAYVAFLQRVMPTLENYTLTVKRTSPAEGNRVFVELSERLDDDGVPTEYPECLIFELDADGKIRRIEVFLMTPPREKR